MAKQLLEVTKIFQKLVINSRKNVATPLIKLHDAICEKPAIITANATRNTNYFNKLPAKDLWKSVTSVSNAGRKRGRAKAISKRKIKDLNKGQIIGSGKANILWPGLNTPILRGKELVEQQQLPENPEREKMLAELRDKMGSFRRTKLSPIERGWSGVKMPGRSLGPPDPVGDDTFEGFDSRVLELKLVFNMKGNFGRVRRMLALVVSGNGNGLGGFAIGKAMDPRTALRKAKNRSAQKLMHIKLFRNHTVCHHFFTQFGATKIYVWQRPQGHGLVCHRAIKTICEVIGIKDLSAKVEGSTNINHIVKAFFLGLIRQKAPQEIAEEKKLHLVEICPENNYFPTVIASPTECRKSSEVDNTEILDYEQYCFNGKVVLKKKKPPPFYTKLPGYQKHLNSKERVRNLDSLKKSLIAEYGEIRTFLTEKYPECKPFKREKKVESEAEAE
ncbi:small ribosomal subunit protein uS5m [Cylas formicarius]|uniref:small ribosomal subunit protein uS5m n=1 Tax=Cylas formicarius TaxID=197179 RepID=UPI002958B60C|nr:small ribosomal subunit protein uS5m [Cylas formicarius]